jgi:hypothetical protein
MAQLFRHTHTRVIFNPIHTHKQQQQHTNSTPTNTTQRELTEGIDVTTEDGAIVGKSKAAATSALAQVVPSRILMAAPAMLLPPIIMSRARLLPKHKTPLLRLSPRLGIMEVRRRGGVRRRQQWLRF